MEPPPSGATKHSLEGVIEVKETMEGEGGKEARCKVMGRLYLVRLEHLIPQDQGLAIKM